MSPLDETSFFSALATRYPNPRLQEGIASLPKSWLPLCKQVPLHKEFSLESCIGGYERVEPLIHPSWKKVILSSLPQEIVDHLSDLPKKLSHLFMDYATVHSPFNEMPEPSAYEGSSFFFLLQVTLEELQEAIELLSLFSLVEAYLKIVDKKRIIQISRLLSTMQKKWLSFLLLNPKRFVFEQIELSDILGKEMALGKKELFEHGMHLFARALFGEEEAFVKLVCYKLDMSLGEKIVELTKALSQKEEEARSALRFVFEFMKKSNRQGAHV